MSQKCVNKSENEWKGQWMNSIKRTDKLIRESKLVNKPDDKEGDE